MVTEYPKRKCSAVNEDGKPCRAWAIHESEPALCSVHAGRNKGGGAPLGNQNALKHGYYAKAIRPKLTADVEQMQDGSLLGELVTGRYLLEQLATLLVGDDMEVKEKLALAPLINATLRTIVYVIDHLKEDSGDLDEALNGLGEEWGLEV